MVVKNLLLSLKSLLWSISKYRDRYNIRLILDSLKARHVPGSIQNTHLGQNLSYIIYELQDAGSLKPLLGVVKRLPQSQQSLEIYSRKFRIGQYIVTICDLDRIPSGTNGVISFLNGGIRGLFYMKDKGLVEKALIADQIKLIPGTTI